MARTKPAIAKATNCFGLPNLGIGVGLRSTHYSHILAERYPIVMHGVSLSIGSADPLDLDYLTQLRALRDRVKARWVSDHLCWTGVAGRNSHDLLPMPYTDEALRHTAAKIRQVQDFLGAPLMLENPSTYVEFTASTMSEWEFLSALCAESGCGLLLDVNNVYVSSRNHGFDPAQYLDGIPWERVVQIHVAGHTDNRTHCVDTHIGPVPTAVWEVLAQALRRCQASILLEWDAEIPEFPVVHREALKAGEAFAVAARA